MTINTSKAATRSFTRMSCIVYGSLICFINQNGVANNAEMTFCIECLVDRQFFGRYYCMS